MASIADLSSPPAGSSSTASPSMASRSAASPSVASSPAASSPSAASPPLRLLFVINGTDAGGTEVNMLQLAKRLKSRGYHVEVLSIKKPGALYPQFDRAGIPVATLEMGDVAGMWPLLTFTLRMARWMRGRDFDVIHSFLPRANIMSRAANWLIGRPKPHVASEHSTDVNRSRSVTALVRRTTRWSDVVLACSPIVQDLVLHRDNVPAEKVRLWANFTDVEALDEVPRVDVRTELGLPSNAVLICSVGRLVRDKGNGYLIRAFASVAADHPEAHLLIVGGGPEEERLRRAAADLKLDGRVHLLGYRSDVVGIVKSCDAFALASLEEGLPVAALEAMACGVAVIATSVGGTPEIVHDDETGILVQPAEDWHSEAGPPPADDEKARAEAESSPLACEAVAALARGLDVLVTDEGKRARYAKAARTYVEARYSLDALLWKLEQYYRDATDEWRRLR